MLYRFILKLYRGLIGSWDEKFHGHWDQAVKNSSCLRAAVLRALKLVVGVLSRIDTAAILWDIAAFFDSIRTVDVIAFGLSMSSLRYSCALLCLPTASPGPLRSAVLSDLGFRSQALALLLAVVLQCP